MDTTARELVAVIRELGSFGVLLWLVIRTLPQLVREARATRVVLRQLVWAVQGRRGVDVRDESAEDPAHFLEG